MEKYKIKSIFEELKDYCLFSKNREGDYIEVTEWKNGEGFDVHIHSSLPQSFRMTWGQYELMKKLIKNL